MRSGDELTRAATCWIRTFSLYGVGFFFYWVSFKFYFSRVWVVTFWIGTSFHRVVDFLLYWVSYRFRV